MLRQHSATLNERPLSLGSAGKLSVLLLMPKLAKLAENQKEIISFIIIHTVTKNDCVS